MSYEITGEIQTIGEIQSFGTKGFKKREVWLTIPDGKYPQLIALEFQGERVDLPDKYSVGETVTITFDLRGREHNGRVYNSLNAWKISGQGRCNATLTRPANTPQQGTDDLGVDPATGEGIPF